MMQDHDKEKVDTVYVIGAGYVGLANGIALAKHLKIIFCDNDVEKVNKINKGLSPLDEIDLQKNLTRNKNNISAINELKKIEELCRENTFNELQRQDSY
jgi:UDP-glucose 6-dehydrogenase